MDSRIVARLFFFAAFAFLLYQLGLIFWPFLTTLMAAATLVFVFQPVHRRLRRLCGGRESLAAALGTLLLLLLIILPVLGGAWLLAGEAAAAIPTLKAFIERVQEGGVASVAAALPEQLAALLDRISGWVDHWGIDVRGLLMTGLEKLSGLASGLGAAFVSNILTVVLNTAVLGVAVFFFLRDGQRWFRTLIDLIPLGARHKERVVTRLDETLAAVVRGQLVTAIVQGALATMGFLIAGLPNALILGLATMFLSLIPLVGAAGVWVPTAAYLLHVGPIWAGVFLLAWGLLVVSLVDNFLKPKLIGDKAKIPTFLLLFGILGGIRVYGFLGIVLGPLMIGLLLTFVAIFREEISAEP